MEYSENDRHRDKLVDDFKGLLMWGIDANTLMRDWNKKPKTKETEWHFLKLHKTSCKLQKKKVNAIAMQEPNADTTDKKARQSMAKTFKRHFGQARVQIWSSPFRSPMSWKPRGTLVEALGDWCTRVKEGASVKLGRCSNTFITQHSHHKNSRR